MRISLLFWESYWSQFKKISVTVHIDTEINVSYILLYIHYFIRTRILLELGLQLQWYLGACGYLVPGVSGTKDKVSQIVLLERTASQGQVDTNKL